MSLPRSSLFLACGAGVELMDDGVELVVDSDTLSELKYCPDIEILLSFGS